MVDYPCNCCQDSSTFICGCQDKPQYFCELHVTQHLKSPEKHNIEQIYQPIDAKICEDLLSLQKFSEALGIELISNELSKSKELIQGLLSQINEITTATQSRIYKIRQETSAIAATVKTFVQKGMDHSVTLPGNPIYWIVSRMSNPELKTRLEEHWSLCNHELIQTQHTIEGHQKVGSTAKKNPEYGYKLLSLGKVHRDNKEYEKAKRAFEKSIRIWRSLNLKELLAKSLNHLGNVLTEKAESDEAVVALRESIAINTELQNERGLAGSYRSLAQALTKQKMFTEAEPYYKKSIKLYSRLHQQLDLARSLHDFGAALGKQGRFEPALENLQKSIELSRSLLRKQDEAHTLSNIGWVYMKMGDYESACTVYQDSYALYLNLNSKSHIVRVLTTLVSILRRIDHHAEAEKYADELRTLSK